MTEGSPLSVTQGGLAVSLMTVDKDDVPRTNPWSIGAYESDTQKSEFKELRK